MLKPINEQLIKETAMSLIQKCGSTTTLDIKKELRKQKYWATQRDISQIMMKFANDGIFSFTDNGMYRTYILDPSDVPETSYQCSLDGIVRIYDGVTRNQARYRFAKEYWDRFGFSGTQRSQCRTVYQKCKAMMITA